MLPCDTELWPITLTYDLWPWTFVVCRVCHDQTLYQIWAKSGNPRQSYCDLNIWPYDLEHVSRVALCSEIVCTKFKLSQAIRSWNVTIFMLIRHVTLWLCPLTPWPWTRVVDRISCDQSKYQIWARSINPRLSYWRFTTDFSSILGGAPIPEWMFKNVDRSAPNLVGTCQINATPHVQKWWTWRYLRRFPNHNGSKSIVVER